MSVVTAARNRRAELLGTLTRYVAFGGLWIPGSSDATIWAYGAAG